MLCQTAYRAAPQHCIRCDRVVYQATPVQPPGCLEQKHCRNTLIAPLPFSSCHGARFMYRMLPRVGMSVGSLDSFRLSNCPVTRLVDFF